jgi:hypothetical protein
MSLINVGYDASGNGNNWTTNNIDQNTSGTGADVLVDVPTLWGTDTGTGGEVRGNYCTVNPLDKLSTVTLTNGNLDIATGSGYGGARGTIAVTSGKWYWEVTPTDITGGAAIGIWDTSEALANNVGSTAKSWSYWNNGQKQNNNSNSSYGASYTTNDVIGVALDMDAGTLVFYKNNTSQGTAFSSITGTIAPGFGDTAASSSSTLVCNFGARPFSYTAPSGFKSLCTTNLPEPTIADGADYMNAVLYTGNGYPTSGTQSISTVGFQPDFVWIKSRTTGGYNHFLQDVLRGSTKVLRSNTTGAENTESTAVTSFNSNGFSLGANNEVNQQNDAFVSWNWKANGSGVSNTAGTINSTVSANTTSGFSIVTYTGTGSNATIGHGLGATPAFFVTKQRSNVENWIVYQQYQNASPASGHLMLQSTSAFISSSTVFNNTAPTSTVFSVGTAGGTNESGQTFVAYVFAPVAGYSAFGKYTGNGSSDGPFVFTGFRPKYVLIKRSSGVDNWFVYDTARGTYNLVSQTLQPNTSNAEDTTVNQIDILSNGFKCRSTNTATNQSGQTYIYACFAENPFKYALAR